jgi:hypothetical protein
MHEAAEFHVQFQLLQIKLISDPPFSFGTYFCNKIKIDVAYTQFSPFVLLKSCHSLAILWSLQISYCCKAFLEHQQLCHKSSSLEKSQSKAILLALQNLKCDM